MNLFQIECFLALSESLNFTRTANNKFITQPTLSRNIATMEQELGIQLLFRNTKTVTLTAAGEVFAQECARVLEDWNTAVERARNAQEGIIGTIKLGIQRDTFEPFIVDLIRDFRKEHPTIGVSLRAMSITDLLDGLTISGLDFIIAEGMPSLPNLGRLLLSARQECVALPVNHPLADREELHMEELKREKFVAMSPAASSSGYYLLVQKAIEANFTPNIIALSEYVPGLMMLVACGIGISVLYRDLAPQTYDRVVFVPLIGVDPFRRWLMWDKDSKSPTVPQFVQFAKDRQLTGK